MKKITYDPTEDAAYIYFQEKNTSSLVCRTCSCDYQEVWGMINIDFDANGRIFWIELIPWSLYLDGAVLQTALTTR